jgi:excisionase family DNA binding protein
MESKLLTTAEAADRLGLSEVRIRQLCNDGRLGRKVGRDWLFSEEELTAFLATDRPTGRPPRD